MANANSSIKMPIGLRKAYWWPILEEPENSRPVYGELVDMGSNVRAVLTLTTASASIPGDDVVQLSTDMFVEGQIESSTNYSDLELNAKLYGHTYSEENGEVSGKDDTPKDGGYSYIQTVMLGNKAIIYRASCFHKTTALMSSETVEADTKPVGDLSPKTYPVTFKISTDKMGIWRVRKDFSSESEADAYIRNHYNSAADTAAE